MLPTIRRPIMIGKERGSIHRFEHSAVSIVYLPIPIVTIELARRIVENLSVETLDLTIQ